MDSQSNFKVDFLDEGEAWSLFEKKAGPCDRLQALAKNVAEACGGLPIAINSVAVALKAKEEFEWKDALRKLTTPSTSNFDGVAEETYSSIEISYSQLKGKELKSTFLLCCIMEYSDLETLLGYGMGLGIFEYVEAMEDARNRVNTLVRKLKDSSLLLEDIENDDGFSLHDVVRDVGRSIASRDEHMFIVANNYIPKEWVGKDILKKCVGISLYNFSKLPEELECPELQFFYLRTTSKDYCRVPDNFFAGMPKLKVLHLARLDLYSIPNSIRLLVNLRTLYINNCKLWDIDFIGEFKQLEILRISDYYSEIEMIPKKICNLTGLRLLNLMDCDELTHIPPNVLSTFTQIEELYLPADYFGRSKIEWEIEGVNILDELKHLKHLTALEISIPDDSVLPQGRLVSNKLERYDIIIGNCSRALPLLEEVDVSSCDNMEEIFAIRREEDIINIEGTDQIEFKHLSSLTLRFLPKLTCFCSINNNKDMFDTPLKADSFRQLRTIEVQFCHKLKNILSFSTHRAVPLLEEVDVSSCDNMEEIFAIRREEDIINIEGTIEGTDQIEFKHLSYLTLTSLPKLTSFCSINNNKDMFDTPTLLFNQKVSFPSLEVIEISKMDDLETIWSNQLCNDSFCNLNSLEVRECNKLLTIFQSNMLERIARLESLTICDCDLVEKIFDLQGIDFEESHSEVESQLRKLVINGLPKLKHIWNKNPQKMFSFQKLNNVEVHDCMSLKYLFPVSIAESLSELEQLDVYDCGVEEFVAYDQGEAKVAATFVFPQITSLELNYLPRLKTFYCGVHTSQWQNLKRLTISHCDKVELFASELFNFQENNEGQHGSSVQPLFIVEKVTFPNLEEITISKSNNLKILWQKGANESFCNLKSMEISDCASVEEIFDCASAVMYHQLQQLNINRLPKLKHIWRKDPQTELSFENLQRVYVLYCESLKDLFPASIARNLSQLVELQVVRCGKLEEIVAKEGEAKEAARFVFPKVTSITLNKLPELRTFYRGVHSSKWEVLKELEVVGCDKIELLASQLSCFQENNIEESYIDISVQPPFFLVEKLVPSSTCFQNLTVLKVKSCNGLKNLMTYSTAKWLVQLGEMEIASCKSMIEVVAKGGDVTEDKIIFSKLRTLTLDDLPSLSCFCSENYTFELPSLEEIIVYDCPEMKYFSLGDITTRILQKVRRDLEDYTLEGGLNTTIQKTRNSRYMYSWRITARQLSLLKCLLTSPLQLLAFCSLIF
ncbi:hypothetical protein Dsin_023822 [Dipteronia sinensis]|uniref:Disease resistance protein At4g27190-like leucine-rich repeats domain-containing protein n=1 Tax=Dipteronia sinensis TaxID=43782 RepID=A0AAE0A502_9ROSI|nr:hypothetical protein Dsin_023822 [Dipteronia sinensis]